MKREQNGLYPVGVIHGRFQVLHNDHLKYLLAGKEHCKHLVVGITNPDPSLTSVDETNPGRSDPSANPLTYFERYIMTRAVLEEAGLALVDLSIVPLPINHPDLYIYYVPLDAVFFLTIYDDWGRSKRDRFESMGLKTDVLWEVTPEEKGISGTDVRKRIATGQNWEHLVPPATAALVRKWSLARRLETCMNIGR